MHVETWENSGSGAREPHWQRRKTQPHGYTWTSGIISIASSRSVRRETMARENSCCCPSLSLSRDSARFYLLFLLIAIYMLAGAAVFSSLERPAELLAHRLWEKRLKDFSQGHNITVEDLKSLLSHYEEARTAGIRTEKGRALWDIPGAFYFVGTVVSTIGKSMDCCPCYKKIALIFPDK